MKITKAKKKQLEEVYETLIKVCLYDGALKEMEPYLADDVMNFGAGRKELTKTKTAFLKQIKNQKKLASGLTMDFNIKPVLRKITDTGNGAVFTDEIVNTVWINGVKNKLKFRISFIFEYRKERWQLVHSHTSTPDSQRNDEEVWPVEELKKRTAVLEKSLDEKIAELLLKNRELEIEAALERVRSCTMSMQKSDELQQLIHLIYEQFVILGFELDSAGFLMDYKETNDLNAWVSRRGTQYSRLIHIPFFDHPIFHRLIEAKQKGLDFYAVRLTKEEKDRLFRYTFDHIPAFPVERMQYLYDQPGYADSHVLMANVMIYIQNFSGIPYSKAENAVLMRFGKVFEQGYTRFLDLQKAEIQTKEAKIETALERVRARTMAMQKSDELAETVSVLFRQLLGLGIPSDQIRTCGIVTFDSKEEKGEQWITELNGDIIPRSFIVPYDEAPAYKTIYQWWKEGAEFMVKHLSGELLIDHLEYLSKYTKIPPSVLTEGSHEIFNHAMFFSHGYLFVITRSAMTDYHEVFRRFGSVFQQSYTRFLDLQKAEAQARESEAQLALERVRARTMAMQKSDELADTAYLLYKQFKALGKDPEQITIGIMKEEKRVIELWLTMEGTKQNRLFEVSIDEPIVLSKIYEGWKEQKKSLTIEIGGQELRAYNNYRNSLSNIDFSQDSREDRRVIYAAFFSRGVISVSYKEAAPPETIDLLERFAAVFDGTYTRFLDLKKAEAQAIEARIEAALERVRSKAMAMHESEDLHTAVHTVFVELEKLSLNLVRCGIGIIDKENRTVDVWTTAKMGGESVIQISGKESLDIHPLFQGAYNAWLEQTDFEYTLEGNDQIHYYRAVAKTNFNLPESHSIQEENRGLKQYYYATAFRAGSLYTIRETPFSSGDRDIIKRFASVLNLTFNRFIDLQNAEAQTRESQIQLALERVRARTMAMQSSEELAETSAVLFHQLIGLGIEPNRLYITIIKDEGADSEFWITDEDGSKVSSAFMANLNSNPTFKKMLEGWQDNKDSLVIDMQGEELQDYFRHLSSLQVPFKDGLSQKRRVQHIAYFSKGFIGMASPDEQPAPTIDLLERFAGVFNLTYTRFNDLQKAEEQSREATIETSLEKVRSAALAMRTSEDLSAAASMVFTELKKLGILLIRSGVGIFNKESHRLNFYSSAGQKLTLTGSVDIDSHPLIKKQYAQWLAGENLFATLKGEELRSYYQVLNTGYGQQLEDKIEFRQEHGHWLMFSEGFVFAWSEKPYSDNEIRILKRFAGIMDLTFRRYMELQQSESSARNAVKQAALDRVRADIASMRTPEDLEKIIPLIWSELTVLGVPFIRCGVFIMDENQEQIHSFLSTPEGQAIAAFHIPFSTPGNIGQVLLHWQQKEKYIDLWDNESFHDFANSLVLQGALNSPEQYLRSIPHGGFWLHFLPFLQGMLYVGNSIKLGDDEIKLVQSVAEAFSTAYARYEDFNKLEAAKHTVEETLSDLKQTQHQLIQSEKMASLGELTAGIAHEIQNPLNFVNNFSEVSNELLDEMNEELNKGAIGEAKAIATDIKSNLEKINHHGKRADAIVKGMLQHSGTSSGVKEPTDLNALADEYLRLAYHGLRAKDKSFNAELKTDYDINISKVSIIPQDFGRAILNLITNAFYAVNEKKRSGVPDYQPTVSIFTKQSGNQIAISVLDNGNGIAQKIVDKIFQPFFTTKPTGQGTGLGLSLSYDIVKAHGGEIIVETREGEGTEFRIQLPV
jgi:signal transduction histidine kinase